MNGTGCFFVRIINTEGEDSSYFLPFLYSVTAIYYSKPAMIEPSTS